MAKGRDADEVEVTFTVPGPTPVQQNLHSSARMSRRNKCLEDWHV